MFILSRIQDSIAVPPNAFGLDAQLAVKDAINLKYSNRLISGVGLAISVYDVLTCTEGTVRYGDGLIWYKTIFRVVVFAPTAGEILLGKITSTTKEHVRVSVEFFDDIYVPKSNLPKTCTFDPERKAFFYQPQDDSEPVEDPAPSPFDQPMEERIYLEADDVVRFRVEGLEWQELEPEPPNIKNRPPPVDPATGEIIEPTPEEIELKKKLRELNAPFKVIAEMNDQGLGPTAWWTQDAEEGEEEGAEGEADVDMEE